MIPAYAGSITLMSNQPTPERIAALANEVAVARLSRCLIGPANAKGRAAMPVPGPLSPAEVEWFALMAPATEARRAAREARLA